MTRLVTLPLNLIPCYSLGNFKFTSIDTEQSPHSKTWIVKLLLLVLF